MASVETPTNFWRVHVQTAQELGRFVVNGEDEETAEEHFDRAIMNGEAPNADFEVAGPAVLSRERRLGYEVVIVQPEQS